MLVLFRRVHGHIIPIRDAQERKKVEGASAVAGGVALGAAVGRVSGGMMHDAAHAENAARKFSKQASSLPKAAGPLFENATKKAVKDLKTKARLSSAKAVALETKAFKIRSAGIAAAAGLIGLGADRMLSKKVKEENKGKRAAGVAAASAGAGFVVHSAYSHTVGLRGVKKFSHAFRRAMKIP